MKRRAQRQRDLKRFADSRCNGKLPCDSELSARLLAQGSLRIRKRSRTAGPVPCLHVYRCPQCDRWHMTSSPPRPGQPQLAPVTATSLGMEGPVQ